MRLRLLLIVFLLAFSATLVASVPVRVLWHQFGSALDLPVEPAALHGNLWRGEAFVPWADDLVQVQWRWQPSALLQGQVAYGLRLQALDTDLETGMGRSWSGWALSPSHGVIGLHLLRPALEAYSANLSGQIRVSDLWLRWQAQQAPTGSGTLSLRNGALRLGGSADSGSETVLPVLEGQLLAGDNGALNFNVRNRANGEPLLDAAVSADTAMLRVLAGWREVLARELPGGRTVLVESEWELPEWAP